MEKPYDRDAIIDKKIGKEYPNGGAQAILRKAIADLAAGNQPTQEFNDYNAFVQNLIDTHPVV